MISKISSAGRSVIERTNVMAPYHLVGKNVSVANVAFGMRASCLVRRALAKPAKHVLNSRRAPTMAINVSLVGRFIVPYVNARVLNARRNAGAFAKARRICRTTSWMLAACV